MVRMSFIIVLLCASAQASIPDWQNGDDGNALLQVVKEGKNRRRHPAKTFQGKPRVKLPVKTVDYAAETNKGKTMSFVDEIKSMASAGSRRGHSGLMTKAARDITSMASDLLTIGGSRNLTLVKIISEMLEDTLLPGLMTALGDAQEEVNQRYQSILKCNQDAMDEEQAINLQEKAEQANANTTHAECRKDEVGKLFAKETKDAQLATFRNALTPPVASHNPVAQQIEYYKKAKQFFNTNTPILKTLYANLTSSEETLTSLNEQCDNYQIAFELHFCEYRKTLLTAHNTASKCYTQAKVAFEEEEAEKQNVEDEFVQEYVAMKKILCYLRVWLEDDNVVTIDESMAATCDMSNIFTNPVELVYPEIPDAYQIDTDPVTVHPGTQDFLEAYHTEATLTVPQYHYRHVTSCAPYTPPDDTDGETVCEGHGFEADVCNSRGCCEFDDGECWSVVGTDPCNSIK
jgi:hypothetical protein